MKIAWFEGNCQVPEEQYQPWMTQDEIMALAEGDARRPILRLLLVPDGTDLTSLRGDDWNDAPADCNAGSPYDNSLPDGSRWLYVRLGDEWPA